jgi:hypothetical protein
MICTAECSLRSQLLLVITATYTLVARRTQQYLRAEVRGNTGTDTAARCASSARGKLRNAELILKSTLFNAPSAHEFHGADSGEVFFLIPGGIAAEPNA